MSGKIQDKLCRAVDLCARAAGFYAESAASCGDGLGREVFEQLAADERSRQGIMEELRRSLVKGADFAAVCVLDESRTRDVRAAFRDLAAGRDRPAVCLTELAAVGAALELERAAVDFYQDWLMDAGDDAEQRFLARMLEEQRGHVVMLADLQQYYEDPEAWSLARERAGLDGA
ncbi:MAG: hypothetical protein PHV85_10135 [Desulfovibrionaceae bacterium]|nr:hypothetical protein [Desulfovibrionaceae bacterium]MDD4952897.1 hypothetical protein [Desulfovibrionaceae bacterium]